MTKQKNNKKFQPTKVVKIFCPKCKEIMVKIYPWSSMRPMEGAAISDCLRCANKAGLKPAKVPHREY